MPPLRFELKSAACFDNGPTRLSAWWSDDCAYRVLVAADPATGSLTWRPASAPRGASTALAPLLLLALAGAFAWWWWCGWGGGGH